MSATCLIPASSPVFSCLLWAGSSTHLQPCNDLSSPGTSADTHSFCIILQKSASPLSLFFSTNKNSQQFPLHLSCFCLMSLLANNTKADFFFSCGWAGPSWDIYFEKYYKLIYLRTKSKIMFFPPSYCQCVEHAAH